MAIPQELKLREALETIMLNTINRSFNGDVIYKKGILSAIEIAIGREEFERLEKIYKVQQC